MTAPLFGAPGDAPPVPPVTYLPGWLPEEGVTGERMALTFRRLL